MFTTPLSKCGEADRRSDLPRDPLPGFSPHSSFSPWELEDPKQLIHSVWVGGQGLYSVPVVRFLVRLIILRTFMHLSAGLSGKPELYLHLSYWTPDSPISCLRPAGLTKRPRRPDLLSMVSFPCLTEQILQQTVQSRNRAQNCFKKPQVTNRKDEATAG